MWTRSRTDKREVLSTFPRNAPTIALASLNQLSQHPTRVARVVTPLVSIVLPVYAEFPIFLSNKSSSRTYYFYTRHDRISVFLETIACLVQITLHNYRYTKLFTIDFVFIRVFICHATSLFLKRQKYIPSRKINNDTFPCDKCMLLSWGERFAAFLLRSVLNKLIDFLLKENVLLIQRTFLEIYNFLRFFWKTILPRWKTYWS